MTNTLRAQAPVLPDMVQDALQDFEHCVRDYELARVRYNIAPDDEDSAELDALNDAEYTRDQAYVTLCDHIAAALRESEGR